MSEIRKKRLRRRARAKAVFVAALVFTLAVTMFNYRDIRVLDEKIQRITGAGAQVETEDVTVTGDELWEKNTDAGVISGVVIPEIGKCPICGKGKGELHLYDDDYTIKCDECYFQMGWASDKKKLIETWNGGSEAK